MKPRLCRSGPRLSDGATQCERPSDDPALFPPRDGRDLVAGDQVPHLVRDRGACGRRPGRARGDPEGRGRGDLEGEGRGVRRRPHRRDRGGDEARRDRVPDASRRARGRRGALRAPGDDLVGRARHLPRGAARARLGHPARRSRRAARGAEAAGLRAQGHADDRAQPRHPRRADHLRAEAGAGLCRVRPRARAAGGGAGGGGDLRHLRRGRHLRQHRPGGRGACGEGDGAGAGAGLDPGDPARPARDVLRHARGDRELDRAAGGGDPPSAAHRGAGGGGVFRARPEGLERHAAQAQPGADREPDRAGAAGADGGGAGDGERRALARARHLALVGGAGDRAGRDGDARLRAGAADGGDRPAGGLSRRTCCGT